MSAHSREAVLARQRGAALDVLVVGGGIVGAGIARDAAMRGLSVGLVDQHDFAFGTSSRSSRLLHGGLRYLAQGRLGLVREASLEKCILHRIAPHLARPLPFVFPSYRGGAWPLWKLRLGVKVYDLLCGGGNLGPSRTLDAPATCAHVPGLKAEGLRGAVRYFDGFTNDARLVIDTLRSAQRHGAALANYVKLDEATPAANAWRCRLTDILTGAKLELEARTVLNAAGPWADRFRASRVKLRLTKGVHLVLDRARLPVPDAVVLSAGTRILFVIPWGERTILGTTDTDYQGAIEDVRTEPEDIRYLLEIANAHFPAARLEAGDVRGSWAGLRPLLANPAGRPSDISRSHVIRMTEPGWFDVAGGKLTTYRLMAQQAVDLVLRHLHRKVNTRRTALEPLVAAHEAAGVSALEPPPVTRTAVEHYVRNEWAVQLDDVMVRRTSWRYYVPDPAATARQVGGWMAELSTDRKI